MALHHNNTKEFVHILFDYVVYVSVYKQPYKNAHAQNYKRIAKIEEIQLKKNN